MIILYKACQRVNSIAMTGRVVTLFTSPRPSLTGIAISVEGRGRTSLYQYVKEISATCTATDAMVDVRAACIATDAMVEVRAACIATDVMVEVRAACIATDAMVEARATQ